MFDWKSTIVTSRSAAYAAQVGEDLRQRVVAVHVRLSRAEQVEVWSVEDENGSGHWMWTASNPPPPL